MVAAPTVLISTFLEPEDVQRVRSAVPGVTVLYAPELLPEPRYVADHTGRPRTLTPTEQRRWEELLAQADVAFDFDWQSPETLLARAPRLRWVQATSAGVGGFMIRTGLQDSPLIVTTAAGIHATPLAEFAVAGALHFVKGFDDLRRRQEERHWERFTTGQLAGRTVTIVGLGGMGRQVLRTFHALGTNIVAVGRPQGTYDALPADVEISDTTRLAEVLPRTDVLVLCCALTAETEGLIGVDQLAALPSHAILVNISRGQITDEEALVRALADGSLRGACLDVFADEPLPTQSPLWALDNVVVSPHSASTVATENAALTNLFVRNLQRWLDDQPLLNTYRRDLGY